MRTVKFLAVTLLVAFATCIGAFAQNRCPEKFWTTNSNLLSERRF